MPMHACCTVPLFLSHDLFTVSCVPRGERAGESEWMRVRTGAHREGAGMYIQFCFPRSSCQHKQEGTCNCASAPVERPADACPKPRWVLELSLGASKTRWPRPREKPQRRRCSHIVLCWSFIPSSSIAGSGLFYVSIAVSCTHTYCYHVGTIAPRLPSGLRWITLVTPSGY